MDVNYPPLHQLLREQIQSVYNQQRNWKPLWHYTTANGLKGIVNRNGKLVFWFTRCDCLNDTSEGNYLDGLFQEIIEKMLREKKIDSKFYDIIKECKTDTWRFLDYSIPPREGYAGESRLDYAECEAFICCFSLAPDLLDMWRYYSKNDGGYALEIAPMIFDEQKSSPSLQFKEDEFFNNLHGYSVIYDKSLQSGEISNIVQKCYEAYLEGAPDDENDVKIVQAIINNFLKEHQFIYKHPCFSSENEYRFVYFRPKKRPKQMQQKLHEIQYRIRNSVLIPYIEISVENADGYLKEIMLSPMITDGFAKETTEDYLRMCGFEKCEVTSSTLPVRE